MSRMIQVRNVPNELHRKLKVRAAQEGVSLSDLILAELRRFAERPTMKEFLSRYAHQAHPDITPSAAELVREDRERRSS